MSGSWCSLTFGDGDNDTNDDDDHHHHYYYYYSNTFSNNNSNIKDGFTYADNGKGNNKNTDIVIWI